MVKEEAGLVEATPKCPSGGGLMFHIARMTGQPTVACNSIFMWFNVRYAL